MLRLKAVCCLLGLVWAPAAWAQAQPTPPAPDVPAAVTPPAAEAPSVAVDPPAAEAAPGPVVPPLATAPDSRVGASPTRAQPPPADAIAAERRPQRFFFAAQLGSGYFHGTSGAADDTRTFSGGSVSWQLALGGRVGRNFSLGAAFQRDDIVALSSKDQRIDGDEPSLKNIRFALWMLGFLVDVHLQEGQGLHFQGVIGPGALAVSRPGGVDIDEPSGFMGSLAIGYDVQIAHAVAVGALLRATYAPLDVKENTGTTVNILVPALLVTATSL